MAANNPALNALRRHVTSAIERGESTAIECRETPATIMAADTFNVTWRNVTAERFDDPRYSRPRYRLRYDTQQSYLRNSYTCGSYKYKRDAVAHAAALNASYAKANPA